MIPQKLQNLCSTIYSVNILTFSKYIANEGNNKHMLNKEDQGFMHNSINQVSIEICFSFLHPDLHMTPSYVITKDL